MKHFCKISAYKKGQSSGLIIVIIGILIFCYMVYLGLNPSIPSEFNPGIRSGVGVFSKILFYADSRLDYITDIEFGQLDPQPGLEYCIAGNMGAILLDENLCAIKFFELKRGKYPSSDHQIYKSKDGKCHIRNISKDRDGHYVYHEERYFELGKKEFPLIYKDGYWIAAEETPQEVKFQLSYFNNIKGTSAFFENDNVPYYAILAKKALQAPIAGYSVVRLDLYIFDSQKQLIYNEILDDDATVGYPALKAVTPNGSSEGFLLVGGYSRVWKYSLSAQQTNTAEPKHKK